MPKIEIPGPFKLSFVSADCNEPVHVHVKFQGSSCKIWVGTLHVVQIKKLRKHQVNDIKKLVKKYKALIMEVWNEHCCEEKKNKNRR